MTSLLRRALGRNDDATRSIGSVDDYLNALQQAQFSSGYGLPGMGVQQTLGGQTAEQVGNDFASMAGQVYGRNSVIFACMLARQAVFSQVRFQWQALNKGRPSELFSTAELGMFEKPWEGATTADMLARTINDSDLSGNSYWTRYLDEMIRLRPDWVDIVLESRVVGRDGDKLQILGSRRIGYLYHEGGRGQGDPVPLPVTEVAHYAPIPDPLATFRGMSWLTPVIREVQADESMTRHKSKFFANGASPNMIVKHAPTVTPKQAREFKQALDEEYAGVENAYRCLHPDTDVAMWDGRRVPARDTAPGDVVVAWSRDGRPVPGTVAETEWQPPSPIVTVRTQRGRVVRTNDRHPFLVDGRWVDAADLCPGDLLVTGLGWGADDSASDLTDHDAWMLGALVGDGCLINATPVVSAWDPGVRDRLGLLHELRPVGDGRPNYRVLGISKLVRQVGLTGHRAWDKRIPEQIMTAPASVRAQFLAGLVDTDGHVANPETRRSMELGITSVSENLLMDAQHLFASLGINASVSCSMPARGARKRDAYRLCVFGNDQARRLTTLLVLACESKASRLATYASTANINQQDRSRFDRVASVEIAEPEPTIGIEIAEHHTHVTGGVVTHNTMHLGGGADATVVGSNLQQVDFKVVQGGGETRVAAAAGVPPIIVGLSEGLASATYSNYSTARRRFADGTLHPLWTNLAGSMQRLVTVPSGSRLWCDTRDVPFLREDSKDAAEIAMTQASTMRSLIEGGFDPDSVQRAVMSGDYGLLSHTGLVSVQLRQPGADDPAQNPAPSSTPAAKPDAPAKPAAKPATTKSEAKSGGDPATNGRARSWEAANA